LTVSMARKDNPNVIYQHLSMKAKRVIEGKSSRFAAQIFNIASVAALCAGMFALVLGKLLAGHKIGFLPMVLSFPPLMLWLGASIFVYASVAHHPNPRTVQYNRWAAYRFYGATGALVVFGQVIYAAFDSWTGLLAVWGILFLIVVPAGLYAIWRAQKEDWQDLVIETATNE
jgi:hypothetical protein